jgi:S1-C subfamily serine protease
MEPTIRRLVADGHAIRKVNIDQERALAQQFGVDRVPTFVMLAGGREVNRAVGPIGYAQLRSWFEAAQPRTAEPPADPRPTATAPPPEPTPASRPVPTAARTELSPQASALHATVRLRMEDPKGQSVGTGTIIDIYQDRALVMTCAHIFRESQGRGPVIADLFLPGGVRSVPGEVLHYDLQHDVGLVVVRPGVPVTAVRVAGAGFAVRRGDRVFSIGCDRGHAPSIQESHVIALNRYVGAANIEVAGQPVIGRSGGGLFAADGQLIGVCNLANAQDNEGIYAALSLLHQNLDKKGLSYVYQKSPPPTAIADTGRPKAREESAVPPPPAMPARMPGRPLDPSRIPVVPVAGVVRNTPTHDRAAPSALDETEVVVIFRSRRNPESPSQFFVVDRPSRELLDRLASESRARRGNDPAVVPAAGHNSPLAAQAPDRLSEREGNPVVRAQAGP